MAVKPYREILALRKPINYLTVFCKRTINWSSEIPIHQHITLKKKSFINFIWNLDNLVTD